MVDLVGGLCVLTFVLGLLACFAVGAWVIGATVCRSIFRSWKPPVSRCPRCGQLGLLNGQCLNCGTVPAIAAAERTYDDLRATARQLRRLHDAGHLPYDQCVSLLKVLETDLAQLGYPLPPDVWPRTMVSPEGSSIASTVTPPLTAVPAVGPVPPTDAQQLDAASTQTPPIVLDAVVIDESTTPAAEPVGGSPLVAPHAVAVQPASLPPVTPSRTLADMLQSFMEESNIRWGEIIGGLLIVVCAIGLVISLGATVKIPYFPALLFMVFTLALHLAGLYAHWFWKLAAVSRAILIIALLLVPLGFSAGVVLHRDDSATSLPLLLAAVAIGLTIFGWITWSGAKILTGEGAWRLTAAVLGCCLGQLVINRVAIPGTSTQSLPLIALLPVASFLIAAIGQIWRAQAWERMSIRRIEQTFLILGVSLFAIVPPLALLVVKLEPRWNTFRELTPLLCLVATGVLTLGLVVHRRTVAKSLAMFRTAGTAIALTGGAALAFLWVIAWPRPDLMLHVSVMTGGLLLAVAIRTGLPALHVAATSALSMAVLITFVWMQSFVSSTSPTGLQWLQASLLGRTSLLLTAIAAVIGAIGAWLVWRRERQAGFAWLVTAGGLSVVSLAIAGLSGFVPLAAPWTGDGDIAGPLFLMYAIGLLVIAVTITNENVLAAGMGLLWAAFIQLLSANDTARQFLAGMHLLPERPVLMATILASVTLAGLALALSRRGWRLPRVEFSAWEQTDVHRQLIIPLTHGAALAIIAATPFILWVLPGRFTVHAVYAGLASIVWFVTCIARRWPAALAAAQATGAVTVAFAIAAGGTYEQADPLWFARSGHLQSQLLALATSAAVWSLVRRLTPPQGVLHNLLHPPFPAADHVLLGMAVALGGVLSICAALPGIAWELGLGSERSTAENIPWLDPTNTTRLTWGLVSVALALVISLFDRITGWKLISLSLTGWAGCFLVAHAWDAENAVASAARWSIALYGGVLTVLFVTRTFIYRGLQTQAWLRSQELNQGTREWLCYQPLVLGGLPVLALTVIAVMQFALEAQLPSPASESIFTRMGTTASYAGPLLIGVAIFLGLAANLRQPALAFGGGMLFQLTANLAWVVHLAGQVPLPTGSREAELLQWNTLTAAIYAILWFLFSPWIVPRHREQGMTVLGREKFYLSHLFLSGGLLLVVGIWGAADIVRFPEGLAAESVYLGHWSNVIAAGLLAVPFLVSAGLNRSRWNGRIAVFVLLLLVAVALPVMAIRWEYYRGLGGWAAYHLLEIGWLGLAAVHAALCVWQAWSASRYVVAGDSSHVRTGPQHLLAAGLSAVVVFLAVWGNIDDPNKPYFSTVATVGVVVVLIVLGLARRSQLYAIASLLVAPLAAALPWFALNHQPLWDWIGLSAVFVEFASCLLAAMIVGGFWQFIEIRMQRKWEQTLSPRWEGTLAGYVAICTVTFLLGCASLSYLAVTNSAGPAFLRPESHAGLISLVVVWLALGLVNVSSLWDRRATLVFPALLLWMWIACALALALLGAPLLTRFCLLALAMAGVLALAGHVWSYGANLAAWGERLGISDTIGGLTRIDRWLPGFTLAVGLALCVLEWIGMQNLSQREDRVAIAFAPALIGYALACLAQQKRQGMFQLAALLFGGLTCVYLGWSDLSPGWDLVAGMKQVFRLLMVLAVVTLGYGLVLPRFLFRAESWLKASQRAGYVSSTLAIVTLVGLLGLEVALFEPGIGAGVEPLQVAAVAVLLVIFIAGLISLALAPGAHEPHEQRRRTWFVYGAQAVAALLFAHIYLCQPGWFNGILRPYWPYVVMAIAFSGVGLGELFWRLRLPILAEPFQRTGALLPVLPILGLWVASSHNDYEYALLLLFASVLYLVSSATRKSWAAGIVAAVMGNGALWTVLTQSNWRIDQNPQFWLIPPSISVLVAAQINRHRLKDEYLSGIRYASLLVIYVSSTMEVFLHRAELSLWPPVVLTLLSLFGALAGVLLRIRAFLYLGAVFTLLSLVSMVWHAARAIDQVWPWWAFGFVMGIAILGLLAFLEKNRDRVQALVTSLRQWDQ
jgi:hypothetical protein